MNRNLAFSVLAAVLSHLCSRPSKEPDPALRPTSSVPLLSAAPKPSSSGTAVPATMATPLKLELRAEDLPAGGQRIVAVIPELGIEEPIGEAAAPFVCQTTLRPIGSEPLLTAGAKWLDVWCPGLLAAIASSEGLLILGKKQLTLPAGRYVSLKNVAQIELKQPTCDKADQQVDVRLVVRGSEVKLEVPKLGLSLGVEDVPRGSGLRCLTVVDQNAQTMGVNCSTDPTLYRGTNPDFQVISGVLIGEYTWGHHEDVGHRRWGIRLPCGRLVLHGLDYRDYRYGVKSCTQKCEDRASACNLKCEDTLDACGMRCFELEGQCARACGN